jgi:hypothetical protein
LLRHDRGSEENDGHSKAHDLCAEVALACSISTRLGRTELALLDNRWLKNYDLHVLRA